MQKVAMITGVNHREENGPTFSKEKKFEQIEHGKNDYIDGKMEYEKRG